MLLLGEEGSAEDYIPAYAAKLKEVAQRLYPFAAVNAKLLGSEGGDLIPEDVLRTEVSGFFANNPKFDLRFSSIHEINEEDYDLTGVSDIGDLKEALAPFQRVSRIVGGKPEAMAY